MQDTNLSRWSRSIIAVVLAAGVLGALPIFAETPTPEAETPTPEKDDFVPPKDLVEGWYARIDTSMGRILARLLPEQAPQSVAHFAGLAEGRLEWFDQSTGELKKARYYDGIPIHLAEAGLRFEAGDRSGTGYGAPDINVPPEVSGPINFSRPGRLGMTRGAGYISGVVFFATAAGQGWLNSFHPCFGEVISGLEVIRKISMVKTRDNGRPLDPPMIERVRIFKVGEPEDLPEPQPYYPERFKFEDG